MHFLLRTIHFYLCSLLFIVLDCLSILRAFYRPEFFFTLTKCLYSKSHHSVGENSMFFKKQTKILLNWFLWLYQEFLYKYKSIPTSIKRTEKKKPRRILPHITQAHQNKCPTTCMDFWASYFWCHSYILTNTFFFLFHFLLLLYSTVLWKSISHT